MKIINFSALIFCLLLPGCGTRELDCRRWNEIARNAPIREEVVQWADSHLFARTFSGEDFTLGRLVGPGTKAIALRRENIVLPERLKRAEIRVIYLEDSSVPGAVFIGDFNFTGIIIARTDLADVVESGEVMAEVFPNLEDRVALVCPDLDR